MKSVAMLASGYVQPGFIFLRKKEDLKWGSCKKMQTTSPVEDL